jgi:hexosaminidase
MLRHHYRFTLYAVILSAVVGFVLGVVSWSVWSSFVAPSVTRPARTPPASLAQVTHPREFNRGSPSLVPLPRHMERLEGAVSLRGPVTITWEGPQGREVARQLAEYLVKLGVAANGESPQSGALTIALSAPVGEPELGEEGYRLVVDSKGVTIRANTGAGLFYGTKTLEQLATDDGRTAHAIPRVRIADWPEYAWRGLHLDVSRHFFSAAAVKEFIDVAAGFKLNTFHWHLTDDQGWRLPIPQYPNLVAIGGCREATQVGPFTAQTTDGTPFCAHYTVDEIRDVVAFAKTRYVKVVPEIEGPGHSVEALASYGSLACTPGPYATLTHWGSTKYSMCPTDDTFRFYDGVVRAAAQLFPGNLLHVGGDEVPFYSWRQSAAVSRLMRAQGLGDYREVQGYFTRRVEAIARKYGKRIVSWSEVAQTAVPTDAIIMSWTGGAVGLAAAREGRDVVMTPGPPLYFDHYQGPPEGEPVAIGGYLTPLSAVYDFDPLYDSTDPRLRKHVLGAQGNLWTEYIPTQSQLWYMAYPRALALAELCWTPRDLKSWSGFTRRAGVALQRLEPDGVTFRIPEVTYRVVAPTAFVAPTPTGTNTYSAVPPALQPDATVELASLVPNAVVHYTLDGTDPTAGSPVYTRPLKLKAGDTVRARAMLGGAYRPSAISTLRLERE